MFVDVGAHSNVERDVCQVTYRTILQIHSSVWFALIEKVVHHLSNILVVLDLVQNLDFFARYIVLERVSVEALLNEYHTPSFWITTLDFAYAAVQTSAHATELLDYCPFFSRFWLIVYG